MIKQNFMANRTTGTLPVRGMRPISNRMQSGRRIMHIAQVIPRVSQRAALHTSSKAADIAEEKAAD